MQDAATAFELYSLTKIVSSFLGLIRADYDLVDKPFQR